jgi:ABC-type multidrug transport system fused ATPase/permease subunit
MWGQVASSLYALAARILRGQPGLGAATLAGAVMHAAGHALLAGAAGALTRALAGSSPMDVGSILLIAILGVVAAVAKLIGGAAAAWGEAKLAGEVAGAVRLEVLDDVLAVDRASRPHEDVGPPRAAPRHRDHGARLAALTSHIQDVERGVGQGVVAEVRSVIQLAPLVVLLVVLAPRLAASAAVSLVAFGVLAFVLRRAFRRAHERAVASASLLSGAADEAVRHAELWATYGAQRRIRAHVGAIGGAIAREAARLKTRASLLSSTSEVLGALALVLVLALAARGTVDVRPSTIVPFAIVFFMAYRPLRDLVDARLHRARGEHALAAALGPERRAHATAEQVDHEPASWRLEPLVLTGVRTRHGAHPPLSLEVPPGRIVALVGPTGIGKTSLLRALLGLDPLAEGSIRYGDRELSRAGVGPDERPFAWVPQDVPIVRGTLAVNVGLGSRVEGNDEARILDDLGAYGLASALGDDVLSKGRLSGGEAQWVAVARGFATGLPVLLLDEPTSALDVSSQASILGALRRLRGRRTVILVTHRSEPLAIADEVVRLDVSEREQINRGSRPHFDGVRAEQLAVEDVGAVLARKA